MPLVVSEAPHLMAITILETSTGWRCRPEISMTSLRAISCQLDRLADAAQLLNVDDLHMLAGSAQLFIHALVVGAFTAKAYDQDSANVGLMPRLISVSVTRSRSGGIWQQPDGADM